MIQGNAPLASGEPPLSPAFPAGVSHLAVWPVIGLEHGLIVFHSPIGDKHDGLVAETSLFGLLELGNRNEAVITGHNLQLQYGLPLRPLPHPQALPAVGTCFRIWKASTRA